MKPGWSKPSAVGRSSRQKAEGRKHKNVRQELGKSKAPRDLNVARRYSFCSLLSVFCFLPTAPAYCSCRLLLPSAYCLLLLPSVSLFRLSHKDLRIHALGISQHDKAQVVHVLLRDALNVGGRYRMQPRDKLK